MILLFFQVQDFLRQTLSSLAHGNSVKAVRSTSGDACTSRNYRDCTSGNPQRLHDKSSVRLNDEVMF
jgi:hypothetical protein